MKKQSNSYTLIYSIGLVFLVGVLLSIVYQALKPMQDQNIADDKKKQILSAALVVPTADESISELYDKTIVDSYVVNSSGEKVSAEANSGAFDVDVAAEVKKPADERLLPVFVANTDEGVKYILPIYGAGLWGPIWGYVSFNADGQTIYGAYFAHQGETPGLGAEIETPTFQSQFSGKSLFRDGEFRSLAVSKVGQEPTDRDYVHAISGGTITSQGVGAMFENSLAPYESFFKQLKLNAK